MEAGGISRPYRQVEMQDDYEEVSTYNEEDKRIGYWKLEAFPDHIDRR